jgi:Ca2+-transporting ATPase
MEAIKRFSKFGPNKLTETKGKSIMDLILEQLDDRLVQILLAVAALSGFFSCMEVMEDNNFSSLSALLFDKNLWKHFVEPIVIVAILIVNATVGVWQSRSAQGSMEALKKLQPSLAAVLRDGKWVDGMDASTLVPGDIFSFRVGDKIPADARVLTLQTSSLRVDESTLTGESLTVEKLPGDEGLCTPKAPIQDMKSVLFAGTLVTAGCGTAVVVRTGMDTEMGKIQQGVSDAKLEEQKTPLAQKLDEFGETLTKIIGIICLAIWVLSIPKWNDPSFSHALEGAIYYAKVAVALGVAAIPEGLPAVITLCLSLGTRRMAQRNVIVRKLPSVETLGSVSVICTDKTGTLTQNVMTVVSLLLFEKVMPSRGSEHDFSDMIVEHSVIGTGYSPDGCVVGINPNEISLYPEGSVADCAAVAALCNDAKIICHDAPTEAQYERVGEPTEAALCVLVEKLHGIAYFNDNIKPPPSIRSSFHVESWRNAFIRSATLEFNRDRKSMSVLCHLRTIDGKRRGNRLLVKGAPNMLLTRCTHIKLRDGSVVRITAALRETIKQTISNLSTRPLRCIALAVKDSANLQPSLKAFYPEESPDSSLATRNHPLLGNSTHYADIENSLTLVGTLSCHQLFA